MNPNTSSERIATSPAARAGRPGTPPQGQVLHEQAADLAHEDVKGEQESRRDDQNLMAGVKRSVSGRVPRRLSASRRGTRRAAAETADRA